MYVLGLTGGIASGKSTVSSYLKSLGIPVFDADAVAHVGEAKGSECLPKIVEIFGEEALTPYGELNRSWVGKEAFTYPEKLQALNTLIHDYVTKERDIFLSQNNHEKLIVLDVPLLIECKWYKVVNEVWLVAVDKETQIERAMSRSNISRSEVEARINCQMSLEEKKKYADVVLDNSGTREQLLAEVQAALHRLDRELE